MPLSFEWDQKKATTNLKKHKVNFDEASTVFDDPVAYIFDDEDHSKDERCEIIIGQSVIRRLWVVCFTERIQDLIRIFSARLATKRERQAYEENASF